MTKEEKIASLQKVLDIINNPSALQQVIKISEAITELLKVGKALGEEREREKKEADE